MSREKGLIFQKGFLLQKGPSHSPLTSTTDSSHLKPDRCAGGYRQESSLCVVLLFFVCVALETWRCRAKPLFFLCCVFIVMVAGVRVQCGCWQNALCMLRWAGGGGTQETGKRKCQLLRGKDRGESEESAVTRLMDGPFDMFFCFF